jgi:hypothetical protein
MASLAWLLVRSGRYTRPERAFLIMTVFCIYATQVSLGVGQMINHLLPALWLGILLITQGEGRLRDDLLGSALIVAASVKPNIFVPFGWIILFACPRWRPIALCLGGYALLTFIAVAVRPESFATLIAQWVTNVGGGDLVSSGKGGTGWMTNSEGIHWLGESYSNLHKLMWTLGVNGSYATSSLIVLAGLGVWMFRNRRADIWTLMAVAALVARLWSYHRVYDDALLLVPLAALSRLIGRHDDQQSRIAQALFLANWFMLMAPARILAGDPPLAWMMEASQSILWIVTLVYLAMSARSEPLQPFRWRASESSAASRSSLTS